MKFIPELAGLRGLAATMVFVAHAAIDGFLPKFIANTYGKLGLICFFILSGYLIAQVYLYKTFNKENSKNYLIARLARIAPVYLLVILASFVISNFIYPDFHYDFTDKTKFLLSLLFINTPYEPWTIPVEVQFYFCFLLFWYLYSSEKINRRLLYIAPIFLLLPSFGYMYLYHKVPHVMPSFSIFFFLGVYISLLHQKGYFEKLTAKTPLFVSLIFLFILAIGMPLLRRKLGVYITVTWYDPLLILTACIPFILIITKPGHFFILKLKPIIFMSEISYGFYLIHRPLMKIATEHFGTTPLIGIALLVICILLSWISFKFIEVPARKFIEARLKQPVTA